uniref:Uncharacterized protein Mb2253c family n=1 Tax=Cajanus cajan TaxID=3821 RepID=A0A151R401_CAJCA|nr:Uncharacterized protein Mb2253c family [Cajanus cajan]
MEELAEFRNQNRSDLFLGKKEAEKEHPPRPRPRDTSDRERNNRGPKYAQYTPLNTSRTKVLEQALATEVLTVPRRAMTLPHADKTKTCQFHRNRGHTTEECTALRDRIEDLVKSGHLQNFTQPSSRKRYDNYQDRRESGRGNQMIIYIFVSDKAISTTLVQEQTKQMSVYFISRVLQDAETRYQHLEKTVLALVHTAKRLRHYFQSHRIIIRTDSPIVKVGVGIILEGPGKVLVELSLWFGFKASNNQAEYEALLASLRLAKDLSVTRIKCWSDSQVVTGQVNDTFQIKEPTLFLYFHAFQKLKNNFQEIHVEYTPRELNMRADQLAKLASSKKRSHLRSIMQQELQAPSVRETECLHVQQEEDNWMTGITRYLSTRELPSNSLEAKKLRVVVAQYTLVAGELYKRGMSSPLLKCLTPEQAHYVLREIHEGICRTHSRGRTLAVKVI